MKRDLNKKGYIAVISALIISTIIIIVAVTFGQSSFFHRANLSQAYFKGRSKSAADACVSTAFLRLSQNPSYTGGETVNVANDSCTIISVAPSGSNTRIIKVQSQIQNSFTNYQVTTAATSVNVIGWEELPHF